MPNYVINNVYFDCSEERVKEILNAIKGDDNSEDSESCIDFNKIIHMPESLNIESGSFTDTSIEIFVSIKKKEMSEEEFEMIRKQLEKKNEFKTWNLSMTKKQIKDFVNLLGGDLDKIMERGAKAINNMLFYGAIDWYDWRVKHWGTKWNAIRTSVVDNNTIEFETAWSCPIPIFFKLSEKFPEVPITVQFSDENIGGGNCGIFKCVDGTIVEQDFDCDRDFAAQVWGYADYEDYVGN